MPHGEQQEGDIKYEYKVYENVLIKSSKANKFHEARKYLPGWLINIPSVPTYRRTRRPWNLTTIRRPILFRFRDIKHWFDGI